MINTACISEYVLLDPVRNFFLKYCSFLTKYRYSICSSDSLCCPKTHRRLYTLDWCSRICNNDKCCVWTVQWGMGSSEQLYIDRQKSACKIWLMAYMCNHSLHLLLYSLFQVYSSEGRWTFTSHTPGEHVICLYSNSTKWFSGSQLVSSAHWAGWLLWEQP